MFLSGRIDIAEQCAAVDVHGPRPRVDDNCVHARQITDNSVIAGAKTGKAVAAAAHRQRHSTACRYADDLLDILRRCDLHNCSGPAIDDRVIDTAQSLIFGMLRTAHCTIEARSREISRHGISRH